MAPDMSAVPHFGFLRWFGSLLSAVVQNVSTHKPQNPESRTRTPTPEPQPLRGSEFAHSDECNACVGVSFLCPGVFVCTFLSNVCALLATYPHSAPPSPVSRASAATHLFPACKLTDPDAFSCSRLVRCAWWVLQLLENVGERVPLARSAILWCRSKLGKFTKPPAPPIHIQETRVCWCRSKLGKFTDGWGGGLSMFQSVRAPRCAFQRMHVSMVLPYHHHRVLRLGLRV
jgi:hypothetical protein